MNVYKYTYKNIHLYKNINLHIHIYVCVGQQHDYAECLFIKSHCAFRLNILKLLLGKLYKAEKNLKHIVTNFIDFIKEL
jgi:hypothetical protein